MSAALRGPLLLAILALLPGLSALLREFVALLALLLHLS
jgi:hypothetical protein